MLKTYTNERGFLPTEFYVDDGFTGTNYERPAFKRMIADVENGTVGTVIVKDLSRLGREYLQTGYYTEIYFPQNDVRCIAINDGFDSDIGENEFAPFRNIIIVHRECRHTVTARTNTTEQGLFQMTKLPMIR